jgi:hypothetical protein
MAPQLTAGQLRLRDGGLISGNSFGLGDGGSVTVSADALQASGALELAGRTLTAGIFAVADPAGGLPGPPQRAGGAPESSSVVTRPGSTTAVAATISRPATTAARR